MAIPASAKKFTGSMDPYDLIEFQADLSGVGGLLETGETIASFTLTVGAEAVAMGIGIKTGIGYDAARVTGNQSILFWLEVAIANREDAAFTVGVQVPLTLSITTSSTPARRHQRTLVVEIIQL